MANHSFLHDEAKLNSFLDFLPEATEDECYLVYLLARSKYLTNEEKERYTIGQKTVFMRKIASSKARIRRKVLELGVPEDTFVDRNGAVLPVHSLAVYASLHPRSHRKAGVALVKEIADRLYEGKSFRLDVRLFSLLQTHASRKLFLDIDIDTKDNLSDVLGDVGNIMGSTPLHLLHTRGGAHVLVNKRDIDPSIKKTFYQQLTSLGEQIDGEVSIDNDSLVPLAGAYQGGFVPWLEAL